MCIQLGVGGVILIYICKLKDCQLLLDLYSCTYVHIYIYTYVVYQLMYENVYGKNAVTLPLDVDRPCFLTIEGHYECLTTQTESKPTIICLTIR